MNQGTVLLVFTDLDGTLLDSEDYSYAAALPTLRQLQAQRIPVIPVTSKTRQEVESLRRSLGWDDPFVVENGSGIYVRPGDDRFFLSDPTPVGDYALVQLGCDYAVARQGLAQVAIALGTSLRGFGDLSAAEIQQLTGLSTENVLQAKAREFTEPFVTPKTATPAQIEQAAQTAGFRVVVGDRFSHLIGREAGKGKAVHLLAQSYRQNHPNERVTTVGLGNSPNDLGLLEAVDIPIVVPGRTGPHPGLMGRGWSVAAAPGAAGWAAAMAAVQERYC